MASNQALVRGEETCAAGRWAMEGRQGLSAKKVMKFDLFYGREMSGGGFR